MKFIFGAYGTLEDVYPVLSLAKEFQRNGFDVSFITYSVFQNLVEREMPGVEALYVCNAEQYQAMTESPQSWDDEYCRDHHFQVCAQYAIEPSYRYIESLSKLADCAVVALKICTGALWACEYLGLPFFRVTLSPLDVRSKLRLPFQALEVESKSGENGGDIELLRSADVVQQYWQIIDDRRSPHNLVILNGYRDRMALPRLTSETELSAPESVLHIGLYPSAFGMHDETCGPILMTGFPRKPVVKSLIQSETINKKVVYTTGTGIPGSYECFLAFDDICRRINRRGIFLCKNPVFPAEVVSNYVEVVKFCNMDRLLAESDLLFHHGGIGTVADAVNAAIPQVVIPRAFDQFDNANRVVTQNELKHCIWRTEAWDVGACAKSSFGP